jgi:hypothetical protein
MRERRWGSRVAPISQCAKREEGRGKVARKQPCVETRVAELVCYGTKHVGVRAEHENELTVLVERERAI